MGTLRTLFAIAVVFAHTYGFVLVGGKNAVQLFYMISGFLISYVLVERKTYSSIRSFYINRYLRLYPIYFLVALLSLLVFVFAAAIGKDVVFFQVYRDAPVAANILLVISNATIFFQDWVMFSAVEQKQLVFSADFFKSEVVLYPGLLVPQAWTLGVELAFYVIAPFVLARRRVLLLFLALSIALRVYLLYIGLGKSDPWTYRFFPAELALFLLGALAHQILLPIYRKTLPGGGGILDAFASLSTYILIAVTLVYWLIPVRETIKTIFLFSVFLLLMPLTFEFQSRRRWDKWIGDLSYPIYISHMLIIFIVTLALGWLGISNKLFISAAVVVLTVGLSIMLSIFVGGPVESLRGRFRTIKEPA